MENLRQGLLDVVSITGNLATPTIVILLVRSLHTFSRELLRIHHVLPVAYL